MRIKTSRQIGQAVRTKRTSLGLTQQEVAEGSSVARSFVNRLEAGTATAIYPEKLLSVLDFLGLSLLVVDEDQTDMSLAIENSSPSTQRDNRKAKPSKTLPAEQPKRSPAGKPQHPSLENAAYEEFIQSLEPNPDLLKPRMAKHEGTPSEGSAHE